MQSGRGRKLQMQLVFVERLAEYGWKPHRVCLARKGLYRAQCNGIWVNNRGAPFHRIRDAKQHDFNGIPPTSHVCAVCGIAKGGGRRMGEGGGLGTWLVRSHFDPGAVVLQSLLSATNHYLYSY